MALHLVALLPWMHATLSSAGETSAQREIVLRADDIEPPARPPEEPRLGLDANTPSSLTWVGYEAYEEHLARLAEIEQAAFTQSEAGGAEPIQPETSDDPPMQSEAVPTPTTEPPANERSTEESAAEAARVTAPAPPRLALMPLVRLSDPVMPRPTELDAEGTDGESPPEETSQASDNAQRTEPSRESPAKPDSSPEASEAEAREPAPATPPGEPEPGERSDRESDPTSVIEAPPENWRLGKPLASRGVELKPQRPDFTLLQRLTLSPCSPLVEIRFGADGRPQRAIILESSGSGSVDAAVEASLYRWRATGQTVDALGENQTFDVVIRLVLNPHCP